LKLAGAHTIFTMESCFVRVHRLGSRRLSGAKATHGWLRPVQ
jgi:hypothetical protein